MYDVQKIMHVSGDQQSKSQKVQMTGFTSLAGEYGAVTNFRLKNEFEKQMTHKYNRIIFPKFSTVDIPGDQYSVAIIRRPRVQVDEETGSSADTSDGGNVQGNLRRSSTDHSTNKNPRPYSAARNEWSLIM
jgi:hypothetical protein